MFPAMWLLDRFGMKITCSMGAFFNALGALVKCFSVGPERWWIAFTGQILCACAQSFTLGKINVKTLSCNTIIWTLGIPPYLAATWFSSDRVSTVTAIAVFGNQASDICQNIQKFI